MYKNKLYNVVDEVEKLNLLAFPPEHKLQLKTSQQGKPYYFFGISLNETICIGDLELVEHHLSVYSSPLGFFDADSDYHYTAYFKDKESYQYRLHVYFDKHDRLISKPLLSKIMSNDTCEHLQCVDAEEAFALLAERSIKNLVACLRDRQNLILANLQEELQKLEENATVLSSDLLTNKVSYLDLINEQISKMDVILQFSRDPREILSKKSFLEKMRIALHRKQEIIVESLSSQISRSNNQGSTPQVLTVQKTSNRSATRSATKAQAESTVKKEVEYLTASLSEIKKHFTDLECAGVEQMQKCIGELYHNLCELEHKLNFGYYQVSVEDLRQLKELKTQLKDKGKGLLQSVLVGNQFEKAPQLKCFNDTLEPSIVNFALVFNKPKLLEFLLVNSIVSSDYKNFKINETNYFSMIDFCFKEHQAGKPKIDLLVVLIKNGCSLMQLESQSNLPFIALILKQQHDHPFKEVLERGELKEVLNDIFYRKLNQVLRLLSTQSDCSDERRTEIDAILNVILNRKVVKSLSPSVAFAAQASEIEKEARTFFDKRVIDRLQKDPDVQVIAALLLSKTKTYINKLPLCQRKAVQEQTVVNMDKFMSNLSYIQAFDLMPSYDDLKKSAIEGCFNKIKIIELSEELLDVRKTISCTPSYGRKVSKNAKALQKRQELLIQEIKRLDPNFQVAQIAEVQNAWMAIIDRLAGLQELLNDLDLNSIAVEPESSTVEQPEGEGTRPTPPN